jgi:hypothetical protein
MLRIISTIPPCTERAVPSRVSEGDSVMILFEEIGPQILRANPENLAEVARCASEYRVRVVVLLRSRHEVVSPPCRKSIVIKLRSSTWGKSSVPET